MIGFLLKNWTWVLIAVLVAVIGFQQVRLAGKDATIAQRDFEISAQKREVTDREAKLAKSEERVGELKRSQTADKSSIEALQGLNTSKDRQMVEMKKRHQKELELCYNTREVEAGQMKGRVLDETSNAAFVDALNSVASPGLPQEPGQTAN